MPESRFSANPDRRKSALQFIVKRLTVASLLSALAMFGFIEIAHQVAENDTVRTDTAIVGYFHVRQVPPLHAFMTDVSWLAGGHGMPLVVLLCVVGFAVVRRLWPEGPLFLVATGGGLALIIGLKALFHRPRPYEVFAHLGYSFPSGHSFFALTVYCLLAYRLSRDDQPQRRRWMVALAVAVALLVGFSRVFLGEHFPSDVIAGFAVAVPWLWGCLGLGSALDQWPGVKQPRQARIRA